MTRQVSENLPNHCAGPRPAVSQVGQFHRRSTADSLIANPARLCALIASARTARKPAVGLVDAPAHASVEVCRWPLALHERVQPVCGGQNSPGCAMRPP